MDTKSPPIPPWELEKQRKESEACKAAMTPSPQSTRSPPPPSTTSATKRPSPSPPRRDSVVRSLSFSPSPGGAPPLFQSSTSPLQFLKSPLIGEGGEGGGGGDVDDVDDNSSTNLDRHAVSGPGFSVTVVARSGFAADLSLSAKLEVDAETAFAMLVDPEPAPWKHSTVLRRRVISGGGGGEGGEGGGAAAEATTSSSSPFCPSSSSSSPRTVEVEQAARWAFFRSVTTRLLVREVRERARERERFWGFLKRDEKQRKRKKTLTPSFLFFFFFLPTPTPTTQNHPRTRETAPFPTLCASAGRCASSPGGGR
jgi:hypothetical protein